MKVRREFTKECVSTFLNLAKTTFGAGMLAYPFLFRLYGVYRALALTLVSATASTLSLWLYIDLNEFYGLDNSMSTIALYIFPPMKTLVSIVVFSKCFLVCVAYFAILRENVPGVVKYLFNSQQEYPNTCLIAINAFVFPLVIQTRLDKLQYMSLLGMISVLILVATSVYRYMKVIDYAPVHTSTVSTNYVEQLGSFISSFTCHQNIFTAHNEMRVSGKTALKVIAALVLTVASIAYISFGLTNYLIFGEKISPNFLDVLPKNGPTITLLILYLSAITTSIPLQINPCRNSLLDFFSKRYSIEPKRRDLSLAISFFLLLAAFVSSAVCSNFCKILAFAGCSFSALMNFVFAAIYHFIAFRHKRFGLGKFTALFVLTYGLVALVSLLSAIK